MRRIGRFRVTGKFIAGAEKGEGLNLFHNMIVLQAQHQLYEDRVEYYAWHPDFVEVSRGSVVPEYKAVFCAGSMYPTWVEQPNEWRRA